MKKLFQNILNKNRIDKNIHSLIFYEVYERKCRKYIIL